MTDTAAALDRIVGSLSCPSCRSPMERTGPALTCERGHRFDIARQGYVSLFDGHRRANTGDTAPMVAARERFLATGHYAPIADAVSGAVREAGPSSEPIADLAGGTGYYLARVLDDDDDSSGIAIDLSASASRRAARAHPRAGAVAADVWRRLPLLDGSCSAVLSVFGPRNGAEIARVLRPGGSLVVVSPTPDHLRELVGPLGLIAVDPRKRERLDHALAGFERHFTAAVDYRVEMRVDDITAEVAMGPSAYHVDDDDIARRVAELPTPAVVTVSVEVSVWRPRTRPADAGIHETHNGSR